jgi:putative inorganic carbon (HCO3(-)) transporter
MTAAAATTPTINAPAGRAGSAAPRRGGPDRLGLLREPAYVLLFTAGVIADAISGNAKLIGFPISPDRLLFAAALALLAFDPDAWHALRMRWRAVHTLLVAMLVVVVFSAISVGTLTTQLGLYALLDRLAIPFLAFTLAPVVYGTERRRLLLARSLAVLGVYLGLTAVFEILGPHALVFPRFIADPNDGITFGRARGPFLASDADGMAMIACGFAGAFLAVRESHRWRATGAVAAVVCVIGEFLTETRSIWIGAGAGLILVGLLVPRLRRVLPAALLGLALVIGLALAASPSLRTSVTGRAGDQRSIYDRENTDAAAVRIVEAHPLDGIGWLEFLNEGTEYVRQSPNYPITNVDIEVHNVFLGRAAELGVPGAALFVACLLAGPGRAALRRRRGLSGPLPDEPGDAYGWWLVYLATATGWIVDAMSSPLPYPMPNLLLWLLAGIVLERHLADPPRGAAPQVTSGGAVVVTTKRSSAARRTA